MEVGQRVRHSIHGTGEVLALRFGRRAKVRFDRTPTLPRTVFRKELELLETERTSPPLQSAPPRPPSRAARKQIAPQAPSSQAADQPSANGSTRRTTRQARAAAQAAPPPPVESAGAKGIPDLRQTLEALRLGVVPARFVTNYTVGRKREIASLERLLDAKSGFRVLWGDYGAGKSHLLDVAERIALNRGFVTARVVLDPIEVSPAHPKRIYEGIVSALNYPDGGRGLEPLMHPLVESSAHRKPDGESFSRFYSPYLFALDHGEESLIASVHDYVYGAPITGAEITELLFRHGWRSGRLLTLSDFRTYGRMYIHLAGTLASWARDAGFEGLVLFLDEVEGIDEYGSELAVYAKQVLRHYAAATVPRQHLSFDPDRHDDLYRGGHPVHRKMGLKYRADQPLVVVLAMTPLPDLERTFASIVSTDEYGVRLEGLSVPELRSLPDRIASLYRRAHPSFALPVDITEQLATALVDLLDAGGGTPRDVVRTTVFLLDEMRLARRSA